MSTDEMKEAVELVWDAYVVMLGIPHNLPLRHSAQSVMARCRDFIANAAGQDPEYVQNTAEASAASKEALRKFIRKCQELQQERNGKVEGENE